MLMRKLCAFDCQYREIRLCSLNAASVQYPIKVESQITWRASGKQSEICADIDPAGRRPIAPINTVAPGEESLGH